MSAVRELVTKLILDGLEVLDQIKEAKATVEEMNGQVAKAKIEIETAKTESGLKSTGAALQNTQKELVKTKAEVAGMSKSFLDAVTSSGMVQGAMNLVGTELKTVQKTMNEVGQTSGKVTGYLKDNWSDVEGELKKVAAATMGITLSSMYMATSIEDKIGSIGSNVGPAGKDQYEKWIREAKSKRGISEGQRANEALIAAQFIGTDLSVDKQTKFIEYLEKEMSREGNGGQAADVLQLIAQGKIGKLGKVAPGLGQLGINTDAIQAEAETRSAWSGKSVEEEAMKLFIKKFTKAAETKNIAALGSTLKDAELAGDTLDEMKEAFSDISSTLGEGLVPFLVIFVDYLFQINDAMQSNPALTQFLAMAIAITGAATSAILFGAALHGALGALGLLAPLISAIGAIGGVLLGPIGVLLLVVGILALIAWRTGALQAAWKELTKLWSESGGDIATFASKLAHLSINFVMGNLGSILGAGLLGPAGLFLKFLPDIFKIITSLLYGTEDLGSIADDIKKLIMNILQIFDPISKVFALILDAIGTIAVDIVSMIKEILPTWITGDQKTEEQKKQLQNYGITGWGTGENKGKIGMDNFVVNYAMNPPKDIPHDLRGEDWNKFQQENPDLVKYYQRSTTGYYTPNELLNKGIPQDVIDALGNMPENPSTYVPEPGNPFSNPDFTNQVEGPRGIDLQTKAGEDVHGSADVEGGLQMVGRKTYDAAYRAYNGLFGNEPSMDAGGDVVSTGRGLIHEGEQVNPARVVRGSETILERITKALMRNSSSFESAGSTQNIIIINAPLVSVEKIESEVDAETVIRKGRSEFEDLMQRAFGHYRA